MREGRRSLHRQSERLMGATSVTVQCSSWYGVEWARDGRC